jgi:hypothetical protein
MLNFSIVKGYGSEESTAIYNGTILKPLFSFTVCHRVQVKKLRGKAAQ